MLVIGDTSQHQGVDAGRPFEQMQDAGMRTSQLDQIMRQKDPELLKAVEHARKQRNRKRRGACSPSQGRVQRDLRQTGTHRGNCQDYAAQPENTIVVSPDNRSRQQINEAIRAELLQKGTSGRATAMSFAYARPSLRYDRRRPHLGSAVQRWGCASVHHRQQGRGHRARQLRHCPRPSMPAQILLPSNSTNGSIVTYDPRRLRGVNVFREAEREFATGDRIQFTAPNKSLVSQTVTLAPSLDRRRQDDRAHGWQDSAHDHLRSICLPPVRSWLRRDLAQLPGTHCGTCPCPLRYRHFAQPHQHPACLRRRLPRLRRRAHVHEQCRNTGPAARDRHLKDCRGGLSATRFHD